MEILNWLENFGFTKTKRTWKHQDNDGLMFYDFNKNNLNVEVCVGWNKKYDFYPELRVSFFDYTNAIYCSFEKGDNYQGYIGGKFLGSFDGITKSLFDELIKHYLKK